jgi:S-adenosylmethionine decarboxylase
MSEESKISFEGPEKVLEIWFVPPSEWDENQGQSAQNPPSKNGRNYLLSVSKEAWAEMLELVHCQILSQISNDKADAYLLSESSMFVYEFQIVIKTCGTTTLLACLTKLLEIAASVGLTKVDDVFYNRQNFFFPEKQLEPHQGFKSECRMLDSYFANGGAYTVGKVNENHYNFYNAECRMGRTDPAMLERDSTLEVLMTGLDHERMKNFYHAPGVTTKEIRDRTGISGFFPDAIIDDYLFEPFGYSLNGLLAEGYFTIHITPQPNCSFVSFETNVFMENYTGLIQKVLDAFRPERFIVAHLANSLAQRALQPVAAHQILNMGFNDRTIARAGDFRIVDNIFCHFEHYDLFFLQFQKKTGAGVSAAGEEDNSTTPLPLVTAEDDDECKTAAAGAAKPVPVAASAAAEAAEAAADAPAAATAAEGHLLAVPGTAQKKRRLDEAGTILKPSSPFMSGAVGGALPPGLSLEGDGHKDKKARPAGQN